jgi:hypothetical protein
MGPMEIHWIDLAIFILYLFAMLGVGFFFFRKNESKEDYYVPAFQKPIRIHLHHATPAFRFFLFPIANDFVHARAVVNGA